MKIVVIGGTGLIGSKLVKNLRNRGHEVIAAAPDTGVNTMTREGLAQAMNDAQVVVDVANSPSFEDKAVLDHASRAYNEGKPIVMILTGTADRTLSPPSGSQMSIRSSCAPATRPNSSRCGCSGSSPRCRRWSCRRSSRGAGATETKP